jgi:succinoglycan biosynthesis protein ExoO
MPEATVIVAAFNAESVIERSVASALAQTVDVEIVVADDCSTDRTAAAVGRIAAREPRIRLVRLEANGGPAAARNRAIDTASGAWLAVLDADDTMAPGRIEGMIALGCEKGADVVLGNFRHVDASGAPIRSQPFLSGDAYAAPRRWTLEEYVAGNMATRGVPSLGYLKPLFRSAFLRAHGLRYDETLRNGEDCHLVFRCLAAGGSVWFSPAPDYAYTVAGGSISARADPAHLTALLRADARFAEDVKARMSPGLARLLARRRGRLADVVTAERALRALKGGRPLAALSEVTARPRAAPRILGALAEGFGKRLSRRRA